MNKAKKTDLVIVIVLAALILLAAASGIIGGMKDKGAPQGAGASSYEDFNGKKIGILQGTNMEQESFDRFPDSEYLYFAGYPDLNAALLSGTIDAYLADEPALKSIHAEQPQIDYIRKRITNNKYSFAFRKNDPAEKALLDEFNAFLARIKSNGVYDEIDSVWFGADESKKVVNMDGLTGERGVIRVVTTSTDEPFSYIKDGKLVGYDIDVVVRFCRENGYAPEFDEVDFSARIPALASGRVHFTTSMNVTPERAESVLFSEPVSEGGIVVAARSADIAQQRRMEDFIGKRVGILTGYSHERDVIEKLPNSEYLYYDTLGELILSLKNGMIDCFADDNATLKLAALEHPEIALIENVLTESYAYAFSKASPTARGRLERFNAFLARLDASGELEAMGERWLGGLDEAERQMDRSPLSGVNGELAIGIMPDNAPYSYVSNGEYTGFDMELITRFAREEGYSLSIEAGSLASQLAGLASGRFDVLIGPLSVTEERKNVADFSSTTFRGGMTLAYIGGEGAQRELGFFEGIAGSFEKNFIREGRWKLILQGVGTTCAITALSALFGTVLAFLICLFRRTGSRLANLISDLFVKLLQGTPMVVLLMILYYVVFVKTPLSAVGVAVVGFALNLGAYGSEIMRSGIESVDGGQREAALALGYNENRAFFKFIFPQAAQRFLPVYRGELVSLLKSTSVVGYIAVQDLTKMSDIIRARTYEAFFPLIATAVIYFILAWLIAAAMKLLMKHFEPKKRRGGAEK